MTKQVTETEITSLNLERLDVEELERRLEMAVAAPKPTPDDCPTLQSCYIYSE